MTITIPKYNWAVFLNDLSNRRQAWDIRIEILNEELGDQILESDLPLVGFSCERRRGKYTVEITVGHDKNDHFTHTVVDPAKLRYLAAHGDIAGVLEFEELNGTKTLVHLSRPATAAIERRPEQRVAVT